MGYVSFNDVIELNGILKEKGLNFKIISETPVEDSPSGSNHLEIVHVKGSMMRCTDWWKHTLKEKDFLWSMMSRR